MAKTKTQAPAVSTKPTSQKTPDGNVKTFQGERDPLFIILIGTNGTGKTTRLLEFIDACAGGGLIIDPEGMEEDWTGKFPEIRDEDIGKIINERCLVTDASEDTFSAIQTDFNGRFLVLDDCRYYVKKGGDEMFHKIILRRRQIGIDVFAACHGITEVPSNFWTFATHAIVFKTSDNYKSRKQYMNPDIFFKLEKAMSNVNRNEDFHACEVVVLR